MTEVPRMVEVGFSVCPNCGYPVEVHESWTPPRCPVIRLKFPADREPVSVAYSRWSARPTFTQDEQAWLDSDEERRHEPGGWLIP